MTDPVQCVILAGGPGTRMRPLTDRLPKALLPVRGEPFASYQLSWLAGQGVGEIVYCIGYLGDMIRDFVGSGNRWGLNVTYVDEGDRLLGTAGALRLALDREALAPSFFLMYGDSFLLADLENIRRAWEATAHPALMTVFRNEGRWERSNVVFREGHVLRYNKRVEDPVAAGMAYVDAGLSILDREVPERVGPGERADLADLFTVLSAAGELAGYELKQRFYEIGSPAGLHELEVHLAGSGSSRSHTPRANGLDRMPPSAERPG